MQVEPGEQAFAELYAAGEAQVVWTTLVADLETPVSAFLKIAGGRPMSFLLESVEGGAVRGRYSIIGLEPDLIWRTVGMRGTGSTDYAVTDLFVPEHLTVPVAPLKDPPPGFEGPLFRMWPWTAIIGETTVSIGVAAAAVDAAVNLCKSKTPAYQGTALRDQQLAQFLMGKARARVEASRSSL